MKRLLIVCLMIMLLVGFIAPAQSLAATTGVVRGGWLRLRAQPSFSAFTIASYYTGTVVTILETLADWYHVRTPDNRTGYMYRAYVTVGGGGGTGTATVWSSNGYGVRLRSGPGTGYRILAVYSVGTPVTILERGSFWSHIRVGSRVGYMMNQFLRSGTPWPDPGPTPYPNATVWSANGYGVRLRTGPGKQYGIIGVYSVGTPVMVIDRGPAGGWDYIQIGSRVGYMMNEFLHYYGPREVTNVTLNYDIPVVGCVMSVGVLTPPEATVSYQWYADSSLVSDQATYTVQAGDAGKHITLVVTGTGAYTGSVRATSSRPVMGNGSLNSFTINNMNPVVGDRLKAISLAPANIPESYLTYEWFIGPNTDTTPVSTDPYLILSPASTYGGRRITLKITPKAPFTGTPPPVTTTTQVAQNGVISDGSLVNLTGLGAPSVGDRLKATCKPLTATVTYEWFLVHADTHAIVQSLKTNQPVNGNGETGNVLVVQDWTSSLPVTVPGYKIRARIIGRDNYSGWLNLYTEAFHDITPRSLLSSVTLNTKSPLPEEKITITALRAADNEIVDMSDATFAWYVDGTLIPGATAPEHTVDWSDIGKTVKVVATGDGDHYAGSVEASAKVKGKIASVLINNSDPKAGDTLTALASPVQGTFEYEWYVGLPSEDFTQFRQVKTGDYYQVRPEDAELVIGVKATGIGDYVGELTARTNPVEAAPAIDPDLPDESEEDTDIVINDDGQGGQDHLDSADTSENGMGEDDPWVTDTGPADSGADGMDDPWTAGAGPIDSGMSGADGGADEAQGTGYQEPPGQPVLAPSLYTVSLNRRRPAAGDMLLAEVYPQLNSDMLVRYEWYVGNDLIMDAITNTYTVRDGDAGRRITVTVWIDGQDPISASTRAAQ